MRPSLGSLLRNPVVAGGAVLLVYGVLSLWMDPGGYLGTDTGGKVATLDAMSSGGTRDPDIGYWAEEWDPDGILHPLLFTSRVGDRWVNVTTLPMIYATLPLYELGGYRLALLLPMAGAVAAAFAARAVARRIGDTDGWAAFWIAALASPLVIYALDLWEHTTGVALVAWGIVAAVDWVERRRPALAVPAGLAFGAAFDMRAEAGVYAVVTIGVVGVLLMRRRRWRCLVAGGAGFLASGALAVALNAGLERMVLEEVTRATRSRATAGRGFQALWTRLDEGLVTTTAISPSRVTVVAVLGVVFTAGAVLLAFWARSSEQPRAVVLLAVLLGGVLLVRFGMGPGFVPGLVPATPLAAVALALGWRDRTSRTLTALAVIALPAVWAFQFLGGARPQWGGRYVLTSGLVLGAIGIVKASQLGWVRWWFVGAAVAITSFGLAWQSERTHDIASARATLEAREEPVLVSRQAFFLRELGPAFQGRQWLTVPRSRDVELLGEVLDAADVQRFALVQTDNQDDRLALEGFAIVEEDHERWLRSDFTIFVYERRGIEAR